MNILHSRSIFKAGGWSVWTTVAPPCGYGKPGKRAQRVAGSDCTLKRAPESAAAGRFQDCDIKKAGGFLHRHLVAGRSKVRGAARTRRGSGFNYGAEATSNPFTSVRTPSSGPGATDSAVGPRTMRSWITELAGCVPMQAG